MSFADELNQDFESYMTYRESVGFATATYRSSVPPFIHFCAEKYPEGTVITKEMLDAWLEHYGYSQNSRAAFIPLLREFSKYLHFLGRDDFIPDEDYNTRSIAYVPYLFSDAELKSLFDCFDCYVGNGQGKRLQPEVVLPVYSRLLYCCGLRPQEPPALLRSDVNLETGDIYIRQSKKHKDRHIIMSEDMRRLCEEYDRLLPADRSWFLCRNDGNPFTAKWFSAMFRRIWKQTGLQGNPRPYDLRHAFASRNIIRWLEAGRDAMELLTYLSAYMGHSNLTATLYYIHLLPDNLRQATKVNWDMLSKIYGEGPEDED